MTRRIAAAASSTALSALLRLRDKNLYATILCTIGFGRIRHQRLMRTSSVNMETPGGSTSRGQIVTRARCALHRQGIVDGVAAGTVGVADNRHRRRRIFIQRGGKTVQHGTEVGLDIRPAAIE